MYVSLMFSKVMESAALLFNAAGSFNLTKKNYLITIYFCKITDNIKLNNIIMSTQLKKCMFAT